MARFALVPLIGAAGLVGPAAPAAARTPASVPALAPAAAASGTDLYVSKVGCTMAGNGTIEAPFCTITQAAAVAGPGQTVLVQPGDYRESVTLTRSGTDGAPITFRALNGPGLSTTVVKVGKRRGANGNESAFTLTGVHDVVLDGFLAAGDGTAEGVLVNGSSRITLDRLVASEYDAPAAIRITGASEHITVSRSYVGPGRGLVVDPGVAGALVTASTFTQSGITVRDAPGTKIVGNTLETDCTLAVDVTGTSPGVSIRNNILETATGPLSDAVACEVPSEATAIAVSAESVPQTVADYNLIEPASGGPLYRWGATEYTGLPEFVAATGQGGHDIAAVPWLTATQAYERPYYEISRHSPAVDSADATAEGVSRTDLLDNPHTDSPETPNTGTGPGYHDRGAVEAQGPVTVREIPVHHKPGGSPLDVTVGLSVTAAWTTDGPVGKVSRSWSDEPFRRIGRVGPEDRHFRRAGKACETHQVSFNDFRRVFGTPVLTCTVVGAAYTPLPPQRVLDTRAAIGVPDTVPIPANAEVVLALPQVNGLPAADISAVVLNVTVTAPTTGGFLRVYPDGATLPDVSNVNFVPGETVPNLVTVPMTNGNLRIRNTASGTVHVVADLQGYYSASGSGFRSIAPLRVLDTRNTGSSPLAPNTGRTLDLTGRIPSGVTAAVLNVTVTAPTTGGVLTVHPYGTAVPVASNLNFVAGQTIPNLVMVPVVDGKVAIQNVSSGRTHVVADLAGWFGGGATDVFVPFGPRRIYDSRGEAGEGWPQSPFSSAGIPVPFLDPLGDKTAPRPTALVANLTVTAPTKGGVLTAHPNGSDQPTASNVNFVAGETAANHAIVGVGDEGAIVLFNNSSGYIHMIVDQAGHFIAGTP
ncbi:right-handed parallel beta-helix repeat-containing protein [Micromonospora sp. RHAY321]|uniref:right-handed parallel beta-helix repeat-containing protein n=1 Tax=Micromonospora sp. RHAY321 TaxID=2944807 RepID=UPI00207C981E|nr:right-handed parallel beta-helix repeat-containing protein [Micromonospora sp. RHAY321]MCO1596807.1 right-handed parallel beta-helix repeat-containing protein [Micromonospora sp. RHAY321]